MLIDLDRTTEYRTRKGKGQKPQSSIVDFIRGGRQKPQRSGVPAKNSKKQKKNKSGTGCFNCRKEGYQARDCSKPKSKSKKKSAIPEKYSYNIELNITNLDKIIKEQSDSSTEYDKELFRELTKKEEEVIRNNTEQRRLQDYVDVYYLYLVIYRIDQIQRYTSTQEEIIDCLNRVRGFGFYVEIATTKQVIRRLVVILAKGK